MAIVPAPPERAWINRLRRTSSLVPARCRSPSDSALQGGGWMRPPCDHLLQLTAFGGSMVAASHDREVPIQTETGACDESRPGEVLAYKTLFG